MRLAAGYLAIGGERRPNDFILLLAGLGKSPAEHARALVLAGLALSDLPAERVQEKTRTEVTRGLVQTLGDEPMSLPGCVWRLAAHLAYTEIRALR